MNKGLVSFGIKVSLLLLLVGVSITLASCAVLQKIGILSKPSKQAIASIGSASGSNLAGIAVFTQNGDTITLVVEIENASPGIHAVHIHEKGDCSAPDGTSAGGHWNPTNVPHGTWGEGEFHLGDIGNVTVGEDGTGRIELTTKLWEMGTGSDVDIVGRGIIVHADPDDFTSQPTGNAGGRIGCGAIELAN